MRGSRVRVLAALVIGVVVVFSIFLATRKTVGQPTEIDAGDRPAIRVETLDGEALSEADFRGKVLYVNFWNTWCDPCIEEEPVLAEFYDAHRNDPDFAMLAIVRRDTRGNVATWVEDHPDSAYPVVFDPAERTAEAFGVSGQPESFMLSADGRIVALQKSVMTIDGLEQMLARAREESA